MGVESFFRPDNQPDAEREILSIPDLSVSKADKKQPQEVATVEYKTIDPETGKDVICQTKVDAVTGEVLERTFKRVSDGRVELYQNEAALAEAGLQSMTPEEAEYLMRLMQQGRKPGGRQM